MLAVLVPSPLRRWAGIATLALLGVMLLWLGFSGAPAPLWRAVLVAAGIAFLWAADTFRRATADAIELTREELRTRSGLRLTSVANVRSVERGAFAMKPSQGFLVRLKEPEGRGWAPGLWWRAGTHLGLGGVIPGGQSRAMAEILTALTLGILPDVHDK